MSDADSSSVAPDQQLAVVEDKLANERAQREKRKTLVAKWRVQGLGLYTIQRLLAKKGIEVSHNTIARDIHAMKADWRRYFRLQGFDPRAELGLMTARYQDVIAKAQREYRKCDDPKDRAIFLRVVTDTTDKLFTMLNDVGLLDAEALRRIGQDDGKKQAGRIPDGSEIARQYADVVVKDAELVSDAERAWNYGDAAAAVDVDASHADAAE